MATSLEYHGSAKVCNRIRGEDSVLRNWSRLSTETIVRPVRKQSAYFAAIASMGVRLSVALLVESSDTKESLQSDLKTTRNNIGWLSAGISILPMRQGFPGSSCLNGVCKSYVGAVWVEYYGSSENESLQSDQRRARRNRGKMSAAMMVLLTKDTHTSQQLLELGT